MESRSELARSAGGVEVGLGGDLVVGPGAGGPEETGASSNVVDRVSADDKLALLQAILDASLDPHILLDPVRDESGEVTDFRYALANRAALVRLGRDRLTGHSLRELFPDHAGELFSQYVSTLETGEPLVADDRLMGSPLATGQRWFDVRAVRVGDSVSVSWRDVTDRHIAQDRLRESQARYRLLAENAADIVVQSDLNGVMGWVSPSVRQVLGWDPRELSGRNMATLLHPDDQGGRQATASEIRAGRPVTVRGRMLAADGSFRWMESRLSPLQDANGTVIGKTAAARDIDARVRSEQALAEAEARYRQVAENAGDYVLQTSPDGVIQWVTPSVASVIGWSPEDLVGRVASDFADESVREEAKGAFAGTLSGELVRGRTLVVRKDGSRRWVGYMLRPIMDADSGEVTGRVSSWWDIQGQVEAEQALRIEHARTDAVLESLLDPHITVAPVGTGPRRDWVFTRVNRAACFRLRTRREDLLGRSFLEFLRGDAAELARSWCEQVVATGLPVEVEDTLIPTSDAARRRWFDIHAVAVGQEVSLVWREVTEGHEAAARVAATRDQYQLLAEHASDLVAQTDIDGTVAWFSPSIAKYGWDPHELVGQDSAQLLHPEDVPLLAEVGQAISHGQVTTVEWRLRDKDARYHWFRVHVQPIRSQDGQVTGGVSGWQNIDVEVAARRSLTESEARYRTVLQSVATGIVLHGRDGAIVDCNPVAERVLGLRRDELTGRTSADPRWRAIREDGSDFPGTDHPAMVTLATGEPVRDVVMGLQRPDGVDVWLLINSEPIALPESPNQPGVVVAFTDITEQRKAKSALEVSQLQFRLLAENSADFVMQGTAQARITWVSPSVSEVIGWTPADMVGHAVTHFCAERDGQGEAKLLADLADQHPVAGEYQIRCADGSNRWVSATAKPVIDDSGQLQSIVAGFRDIQAEHEIREALAASEDRYRMLAENASDVVFRVSLDGTMEWVSPSVSVLLGWSPEELAGRQLADHVHSDDLTVVRAAESVLTHGEPAQFEARVRTASGSHRWLAFTVRPVHSQEGAVVGRIGSCHDVTEAHAATEELRFLATHDPMTRLANRGEAFTVLGRLVAQRRGGHRTAVLFADLDGLKAINDTHGHGAGDAAIIETAHRVQATLRAGDTAARIGGDEFLIVIPDIASPADAQIAADKIKAATSKPMAWQDLHIPLALSIGIHIAQPGEDPEDAVAAADAAAYQNKRRRDHIRHSS